MQQSYYPIRLQYVAVVASYIGSYLSKKVFYFLFHHENYPKQTVKAERDNEISLLKINNDKLKMEVTGK